MDSVGNFLPPPDPHGRLPWLQLIRTPQAGPLTVIILSTEIIRVWVHRIEKQPYMCPGEGCKAEGCPNTGRGQSYVEVMSTTTGGKAMLELTDDTYHRIREISVEEGLQIRGLELRLERAGNRRNSVITVTSFGIKHRDRDLPPPRDMKPFVLRLFKKR